MVKIVDSLIFHAILQNASDIHIEPGEKELTVRYRIDGICMMPWFGKKCRAGITARIKVLANLKLDEKRLPQDGRFKIDQNGEKFLFVFPLCRLFWRKNRYENFKREGSHGFSLERLRFSWRRA